MAICLDCDYEEEGNVKQTGIKKTEIRNYGNYGKQEVTVFHCPECGSDGWRDNGAVSAVNSINSM